MDTLHIFTIPKWFPYNIPPELWAIIFCWKWKLEMKDIHRVLIEKTSNIHTNYVDNDIKNHIIGYSFYDLYTDRNSGNNWVKLELSYEGVKEGEPPCSNGPELVTVYPKCGIELILPSFGDEFSILNIRGLRSYLATNLGINCRKNTTYYEMMKLLRTV